MRRAPASELAAPNLAKLVDKHETACGGCVHRESHLIEVDSKGGKIGGHLMRRVGMVDKRGYQTESRVLTRVKMPSTRAMVASSAGTKLYTNASKLHHLMDSAHQPMLARKWMRPICLR